MDSADIVREYHNQNPQIEWERLEGGNPALLGSSEHLLYLGRKNDD